MALTPSLSEIVNVPADPERGSGEPAVVYDNRNFLQTLNQQAQFKAENDWRKYNMFINNLKEVYKDMDTIQAQDVLTEDREYLGQQAKDIFADVLKNPNAIYSPELQSKIGKLRSETVESKQNNLFDKANREFLTRNPELNTESNKSKITEFLKGPLGKRQAYNLDMPYIVDLDVIHDSIIKDPSVSQPWADSQVTDEFIVESSGTNYLRNPYLKAWDESLNFDQDKYGRPIAGYAQQLYNQLPEAQRKKWDQNGGVKAFWHSIGESRFGSEKDIRTQSKENVQQNPNYLKKRSLEEDIRHNKAMEGIGWYNATKPEKADEAAKENIEGNALNDIEINDKNSKPGLYVLGPAGNKQRMANIQRLLGDFKDKNGKALPVLSNEMLKSNKEKDKISYRVQNVDGKPIVTEIQIGKNGKWYNRNFFRNAQLGIDKEPLKGERYQYEPEQRTNVKPASIEDLRKQYDY